MAVRPLFEAAMSPTSTGLPSPNSSYSSLLSETPDSSSYFSSSSSSVYHAHRTPLRSPRTPRPSPLFRLLQPFVLKAPPNTPTSTSPTTDTSPFMVLHHPTPQSYQPPSPTNTTAPRPPTPSRSERLLRDALMRDELERPPLPSSPLVASAPSPSSKTHRRRHSHVPTSTTVAGKVQAPSSPEQDREEYTRGAFLFRTAMNNPRSTSPGIPPTEKEPRRYYGGDAERSASPTPTTPHRGHHHHSQSQYIPQAQKQPQQPQPHSNPRSATRPTQSPSARSTSHSPSPMRHRRQAGGSLSLNRPSPLPLDNESPARRAKSPINPRQQAGPTSPGEPLVMTPHEQVLRARLERVLSAGRVVEKGEKEKEVELQRHIMRQKERRNRERSESRGNEVRDEEGGWPWREQEREYRGVWGVEETATTTSPLYSSTSNNSGSSGVSPALEGGRPTATPTKPTHNRTRSKTEPHSPPPRSAAVPSPRRSSTVPTPSKIPLAKSAASAVSRRTGTTPPLVRGQADNGHEADADDADDDDDGDLRLLTPPPTPPFTARMFSFSLGGSGEAPYHPSPYKTKNSPATSRVGAGSVGQSVGRKKSDAATKDGKNPTKKAGLVLGSPRRPRNAPVHVLHSSSSGHEHEHDDGGADASCSSSASSNSQASFPASDLSSGLAHPHLRPPPHSPTAQHLVHQQRPQFNARKASERCRAMEGYVSFASVEGLGEPPADPMSPDGVVEGEDGVKTRSVLGLGAAGVAAWGGWRRLLGVAGVVGVPHEDGQQQQPGVVL